MRILIATVTAGGGHLAAAQALEEGWRAERPNDQVERVDVLRFFSPLHRKVYAEGYLKMAGKAPEFWGMVFQRTDNPGMAKKLTRVKRMFPSASRSRFTNYLVDFKPEVVLCTHYLPLEALSLLGQPRSRQGMSGRSGGKIGADSGLPTVASIVTDFEAHALWMDPCVDLYCVATEQTKARLVARGAEPERVVATGIPISSRFSLPLDAGSVRKRLGLRDDLPVVLVLSGGFGMGPVAEIVSAIDQTEREFQIVVVTGKNQDLRRELASQDRKHPAYILGFADNMHELMGVADLIVTKPGGLTSSEALAVGKPLFIVNPIPGQEAANSDFLLEQGAAAKANRVEDLPYRIQQLLGSPKLAEMGRAARKLGRPDAAIQVCREALKRVGQDTTASGSSPIPA